MKKWSHRTADIANKLLVVYFVLGSTLFFLTILLLSVRDTPQSTGYLLIFLGLGFLGSLFAFGRFVNTHSPTSRRPLSLYATVRVAPYDAFVQTLFHTAQRRSFSPQQTIALSENAHTTFAYLAGEDSTVLLQTVWMPDFDAPLVDAASDAVWNGILAELADCFAAGTVTLLQVVCVQRMNSSFRTFTARKVYQQERRYHIVCPLSFGGKKAYLRPAKGIFLDPYYKQAESLFRELTADVLEMKKRRKRTIKGGFLHETDCFRHRQRHGDPML